MISYLLYSLFQQYEKICFFWKIQSQFYSVRTQANRSHPSSIQASSNLRRSSLSRNLSTTSSVLSRPLSSRSCRISCLVQVIWANISLSFMKTLPFTINHILLIAYSFSIMLLRLSLKPDKTSNRMFDSICVNNCFCKSFICCDITVTDPLLYWPRQIKTKQSTAAMRKPICMELFTSIRKK